jgi:hypothetical protein
MGADNRSPNASRIQDYRVNTNTLATFASFFPLWLILSKPFGQLFSNLASENTGVLASLASALKNLLTPLFYTLPKKAYAACSVY